MHTMIQPDNFRDVQTLHEDKASMDQTLIENEFLTFTCSSRTSSKLSKSYY